jgi:ABC-type oligopeptide transport system substrate-binding subunit/class 3 adenylate cyclase
MTETLLQALCAYIPHDRVEHIVHPDTPLPEEGVALIADISGFTPLTEALTHGLSADQGAEELTHALDGVFTPLIEEIHAYRGSVIKFGGDALIVWYGRTPRVQRAAVIRRALTSAWRMQQAIEAHGQVPTPIGIIALKMKVGLTYGPIKRFNLGLPKYGFEDVLGGATLDRMAEAEHHAEPDDIMVDRATLAMAPNTIQVAEWRDEFAVVGQLLTPARRKPWPALSYPPDKQTDLVKQVKTYVPQQIYQILASGRPNVAELKPVVSLFVQFHGIDYDADPVVEEKLQTYFATAQEVAAAYGGRVNRLITGDKGSLIHLIFGAPKTVEEQEKRAVRCALELQKACGGLPFISMQRIGMTAGRVFAGPVGSPNRHDYTTMGDSINLSARLMQNAQDDQILMETAVRQQLDTAFEVADLGQIMVKGKSAPIPIFAPLQFSPQKERAIRKQTVPVLGRDDEMGRLNRRLAKLTHGGGGIITLVGEVGMGKTHILTALRTKLTALPILDIAWADGLCLAYGQSLSGYLFIDLLRDLVVIPPGASPEDTGGHLADFCRDLFGPARLDSAYPYLARFMGLPLDDEPARRLEGLSGESLRWQLFELFREMIMRLIARRPLVLALDDLQWADPTSIQLLESLLPLASTGPIIFLLAMRPDRDSRAWEVRQRLLPDTRADSDASPQLDLILGPIDRRSADLLIGQYASNLPNTLLDYLVEKGGGNPLFLVELMHTLEVQGLLADGRDLQAINVDALDLPNSVQGLLLAQIDRLTVEARHTLQMASVIGRTFLYKVLDELAAGEKNLDRQLITLEERDYVHQADPTEMGLAYLFRHALIQESAYGTLLYEHRRAYHRQVAQALERLFPAQIAEQSGVIAFHYEQADDLEQAIIYHLQAADQARLIWANEEAEALYRKVLKLFELQEKAGGKPGLERRAKTYLKIAQVRSNTLDFEGAQEYYEQAFDSLKLMEQPAASPTVNGKAGKHVLQLGVLENGPTTLDPGLSEVRDVSEIIYDLFEGLVELDSELNLIPAAARRWQVDQDGKQYRFELHRDLKWSDGVPLTAHDFVFAWHRNLHPQTGAGMASQLYIIEGAEAFHQEQSTDPASIGVKALNDFTLEITLRAPTGYFLYLLADPITFPQPAHVIRTRGNNWHQPENLVCNGPFKITSWKKGQEICLEKNPFYRGFALGNLEKISLYFIEPTLEHYSNRKIDWCRVDDQADLPVRYPDETLIAQYLQTFFLAFSCDAAPFNQVHIRQAFARSINQKALVKQAWSDVQQPALGGVIPPGMPGHSPEIGLQFDPAASRRLLGASQNLTSLTLATLPGSSTTPHHLSAGWREHLGLEVKVIEDMPIDDLLTSLSRGSVQLAVISWSAEYPDPDSILRILFHSASPINYFGYKNKKFDMLVERAANLTDQQERLKLYHEADQILVTEDTAVVPLYYRQAYNLIRPGFKLEGVGKIIRNENLKLKNVLAS